MGDCGTRGEVEGKHEIWTVGMKTTWEHLEVFAAVKNGTRWRNKIRKAFMKIVTGAPETT